MDVTFFNPAGFWALLGIPAILAIHFLQRESRRCMTSTLFLLETLAPVSAEGRRIERLRNSLPLWLQLAAIAVLAWILADPRWLREDSFQSVSVVLDSSVSMDVFRSELHQALQKRLGALSRAAKRTEWTLTESDLVRPTWYTGGDLEALLQALDRWSPRLGDHDPTPALTAAQGLRRKNGVVIFATDHRTPVPAGVDLLAVGESVDNCGFAGLRADADGWSALVINSGLRPQTRTWWIESPQGTSKPVRIDLAPGEIRTLHGRYFEDRCTLVLSQDRFTIDDRLPLVRPQSKRLTFSMPEGQPFFDRLAKSVPASEIVNSAADVPFYIYSPLAPAPIPPRSISVLRDPAPTAAYIPGEIIAEEHPFTKDLNWQGLLLKNTLEIPPKPGDEVLVWQGHRPLIFLRGPADARALIFNFDLVQSNADRIPAVIVLTHRFLESVRAAKVAKETMNVETNQLLEVAAAVGQPEPRIEGSVMQKGSLRAPERPGFFRVVQDTNLIVDGAAHFADTREADLRQAVSFDELSNRRASLIRQNSRSDFLTPWFLVLLVALCLANWVFVESSAGASAARQPIFDSR